MELHNFFLLKVSSIRLKLLDINYRQTYPLRQSVMWPDQPLDFIKIKGDTSALHYAIEEAAAIRSVVSLFIKDSSAQIRKLATESAYRNRSFASTLINHCIAVARENNCSEVWLNARKDKTEFYTRFGFKPTEETFVKKGISYIIMNLELS